MAKESAEEIEWKCKQIDQKAEDLVQVVKALEISTQTKIDRVMSDSQESVMQVADGKMHQILLTTKETFAQLDRKTEQMSSALQSQLSQTTNELQILEAKNQSTCSQVDAVTRTCKGMEEQMRFLDELIIEINMKIEDVRER